MIECPSVRASVKPDHIVSMIDGKPYRMLKRHLSLHGYTPESYRETFGGSPRATNENIGTVWAASLWICGSLVPLAEPTSDATLL